MTMLLSTISINSVSIIVGFNLILNSIVRKERPSNWYKLLYIIIVMITIEVYY